MTEDDRPQNLLRKVFGDRRDQRKGVRAAGFDDEAQASAWALGLGEPGASEVELIARIRAARPDLTLSTATYIAGQARTRSA